METLDKHFRTLTKAAFEKHGFQSADLLSHWAVIVGDDVAALCVPERIAWSRPKQPGETPAGTLTLRSAPGRALDIQYKAEVVRDRINAYLGYAAIAKVKVVAGQAAIGAVATKAGTTVTPATAAPLPPAMAGLEDDALKQALVRLREGILTGKTRSPQG
ncbi:MAG: DUF721 domain-containing protein [Rhizobiales bacterium]|nr:DUF721 domain-containing protein [Hyphomicrobiales bacterium]